MDCFFIILDIVCYIFGFRVGGMFFWIKFCNCLDFVRVEKDFDSCDIRLVCDWDEMFDCKY